MIYVITHDNAEASVPCVVCGRYLPVTEAVWVGNRPFCQDCVEPMELPYRS